MFERLDSMREVGQFGPVRFTPAHLAAAVQLFGWRVAPHEVEALVHLDLVTLFPEPPEDAETERPEPPAWPERKA